MTQGPESPSAEELRALSKYAVAFASPGFVAGEWVHPESRDDRVIVLGWWSSSETVLEWEQALYDHHILNLQSDYMAAENVDFVSQAIENPDLLHDADLDKIRTALTFLMRAERHTGGGWYEKAFAAGMPQAATRRLGELGEDGA